MPLEVVALEVPSIIATGLASGNLERVGGVVRDAASKQVVMWLREGGQLASNPDLAGGLLKTLIDVGSGGLLSGVTGIANAVVESRRHDEIIQHLRAIQGLSTVAAAAPVIGVMVQIATTVFLAKKIDGLQDNIVKQFKLDRHNRLESSLEFVDRVVTQLSGERKNIASDSVARDLMASRINLQKEFKHILDDKKLTVEQTELAINVLLQAMQVDIATVRLYLDTNQNKLARDILSQALGQYRELAQTLVLDLLGEFPARYFNSSVETRDFCRFLIIEEWLRCQQDVLLDIVLDYRMDFWKRNAKKSIGPNKRDVRGFTYVGHIEALSYAESVIEYYERLRGFEAEIEAIERLGISHSEWTKQQEEALAMAEINLADHNDYVALVDSEALRQLETMEQ